MLDESLHNKLLGIVNELKKLDIKANNKTNKKTKKMRKKKHIKNKKTKKI